MNNEKDIEVSEDISIIVSRDEKMKPYAKDIIVLSSSRSSSRFANSIEDCLQSIHDSTHLDTIRVVVIKKNIPLWLIHVWYILAFKFVFKGVFKCNITLSEDDAFLKVEAKLNGSYSKNEFKRFTTIIRQPFNNNFLLSNIPQNHYIYLKNILHDDCSEGVTSYGVFLYVLGWVLCNNGSKTLMRHPESILRSHYLFLMKLNKIDFRSEYVSSTITFDETSSSNSFCIPGSLMFYSKSTKSVSLGRLCFSIVFEKGCLNSIIIKRDDLSAALKRDHTDIREPYLYTNQSKNVLKSLSVLNSILSIANSICLNNDNDFLLKNKTPNGCIELYNNFAEYFRKNINSIIVLTKIDSSLGEIVTFDDFSENTCKMRLSNSLGYKNVKLT